MLDVPQPYSDVCCAKGPRRSTAHTETMVPSPSSTSEKTHKGFEEYGVELTDQGRVAWTRDSKQHPRNWGVWSKCYTAVVVIWLEAFTTAISSAGVCLSSHFSRRLY